MKKTLSILLVISLLAGILGFSASAVKEYPESEHNYKNDSYECWEYKSDNFIKGMYVTFSDKCYFEPYVYYDDSTPVPLDELTDEIISEMAYNEGYYKKGDYVIIDFDYSLNDLGTYTGSELAGKTIYVPGDHFWIQLYSDDSVTGYGFEIDKIEEIPANPDETGTVNYHIGDKIDRQRPAEAGERIVLDEIYHNYHTDNNAIIGWKTEDGKEFYYSNIEKTVEISEEDYEEIGYVTDIDIIAEAGKEYDLYPIYCKIGLTSEETFSFFNRGSIFSHDFGGYVYTKEAFRHQFIDWLSTAGLTPVLPLALVALVFITAFWPDSGFSGSCCGFPITAILQHEGKIDLLSEQGVDNVSELKPTDELQSTINFYNNAAIAAHLVNHWAFTPGTKEYTRQLKDLYTTLEAGTPVYFELYPHSQAPLKAIAKYLKDNPIGGSVVDAVDAAHGILLDGAFTDSEGNHILLGWDNNSELYSKGYADVIIIDKDFSYIYSAGPECSYGYINGFSWNDDMSVYESFPTEGVPNPFAWHIEFIQHIFELISHSILNLFN